MQEHSQDTEQIFNDVRKHIYTETMKQALRMTDIFMTGGMPHRLVIFATICAIVEVAGVMLKHFKNEKAAHTTIVKTIIATFVESAKRE